MIASDTLYWSYRKVQPWQSAGANPQKVLLVSDDLHWCNTGLQSREVHPFCVPWSVSDGQHLRNIHTLQPSSTCDRSRKVKVLVIASDDICWCNTNAYNWAKSNWWLEKKRKKKTRSYFFVIRMVPTYHVELSARANTHKDIFPVRGEVNICST